MVTAGLTWQPEIGPSVYASARTTSPNANAVVTTPAEMLDPANLNPKDSVVVPTAKMTSNAVPKNSANNRRPSEVLIWPPPEERLCDPGVWHRTGRRSMPMMNAELRRPPIPPSEPHST